MFKSTWVSTPKQNPQASLRLFCFPYSGAAASIFYSWSGVLPGYIEVLPIQYPGHGTRVGERLISNISEMVEQSSQALMPYFDKPFAFFGHSMGAQLCFELARWLRNSGYPQPKYLFVSGHNAPQIPDAYEPSYNLPDAEFIERLRSLNGTPEDVLQNEELRELILPILRADFECSERYIYSSSPPLEIPLCACGGLQDQYVTRSGLEAWREHTMRKFSARMFPGDHFYLNTSRLLLLQVIARELTLEASL